MFISERRGTVQMRKPDGTISQVLNISGDVNAPVFVDQGLLGFALSPGFDRSTARRATTATSPTRQRQGPGVTRTVSRVERIEWDGVASVRSDHEDRACRHRRPGGAAAATPARLSPTSDCLPSDAYTHSAGGLAFGSDEKLWISVPDGASPEGPDEGGKDPLALRAQNPNSLAGKLLRVDPATGDGVPGNPDYPVFDAATARSPASRTWVKGFRNPFRLAQRPGRHAGVLHHRRGLGSLGGGQRRPDHPRRRRP